MKSKGILAAAALLCPLLATAGATDDIRCEKAIDDALSLRCGSGGGSCYSDLQKVLLDLMDGDTNRFETLLQRKVSSCLAASRNLQAECATAALGRFGTTNSLPFLYDCATNAVVGQSAMIAAVKIGGIGSNLVERLSLFLDLPTVRTVEKVDCCEKISKLPTVAAADPSDKLLMADTLRQYALTANVWTRFLDKSIVRFDPTYLHSKRRLAVMRSVVNLDLNDYDVNFVTNTINELVAYPESALGD